MAKLTRSSAEAAYIVNDASPELLVVSEEFFPLIEQVRPLLSTVKQIVALTGLHFEWEPYAAWRGRQGSADPHLSIAWCRKRRSILLQAVQL